MTKSLPDGTIIHLDEIAQSLRRNAEVYISSCSPEPSYVIKFRQMYEFIAVKIETDQKLPVNMVDTALRIIYFKKDRYTIKQMSNILRNLGGL